jgi:hypothetical protein
MNFILVDIGCIECGEESKVLGIYESEDDAKKAWLIHAKNKDKDGDEFQYFHGGQHKPLIQRFHYVYSNS